MSLTATSVHVAQTGFIGPISGPMLPNSVTAVVVMVTVLASTAAAVLGVRPRRYDDHHLASGEVSGDE